jgi:hypothetical protein
MSRINGLSLALLNPCDTFQPLFKQVLELCENGNEEIAYTMLWSGRAYSAEEAMAARQAKAKYGSKAA